MIIPPSSTLWVSVWFPISGSSVTIALKTMTADGRALDYTVRLGSVSAGGQDIGPFSPPTGTLISAHAQITTSTFEADFCWLEIFLRPGSSASAEQGPLLAYGAANLYSSWLAVAYGLPSGQQPTSWAAAFSQETLAAGTDPLDIVLPHCDCVITHASALLTTNATVITRTPVLSLETTNFTFVASTPATGIPASTVNRFLFHPNPIAPGATLGQTSTPLPLANTCGALTLAWSTTNLQAGDFYEFHSVGLILSL